MAQKVHIMAPKEPGAGIVRTVARHPFDRSNLSALAGMERSFLELREDSGRFCLRGLDSGTSSAGGKNPLRQRRGSASSG